MNITITSAGNSAHALVPLLRRQGHQVNMLTTAKKFVKMGSHVTITATYPDHTQVGDCKVYSYENVEEALFETELIIMPVPADAYAPILHKIHKHIQPGMQILVTPGQGGFLSILRQALPQHMINTLHIMSVMPLPFNCRTTELGLSVDVNILKPNYYVASNKHPGESVLLAGSLFQGSADFLGPLLNADLMAINPPLHTGRTYNMFLVDDEVDENPLFYEGMTDQDIVVMDGCQDDITSIQREIGVELPTLEKFLVDYVYRDGSRNLLELLNNHAAYQGLHCPLVKVGDKYRFDFNSRYYTEDVKRGLVLLREWGMEVGVQTPTINYLIDFFEELKERYTRLDLMEIVEMDEAQ